MENQIHPKLGHLSESQIETLMARYYNNEKTHALVREYQIDCVPSQLCSLFPPETLADEPCPYCDVPMVRKRQSRSSLRYRRPDPFCPACGHRGIGPYCGCANCVAEKRLVEAMLREEVAQKIRAYCQETRFASLGQPTAKDLDLRMAVALLALSRTCLFLDEANEDESVPPLLVIEALAHATIPLAPQGELADRLLTELMSQGLISISERSAADAFTFERGQLLSFFPSKVRWLLTVEDPRSLLDEISLMAEDAAEWPEHWLMTVKDLWLEIALEECREFFRRAAEQRKLPEAGKTSTETMLKGLLQHFSVAQCYRVIWMGALKASDFLVRKGCTRQHAANYMIGECQRWADRARAEGWEVKPFKRNFDLPRSSISHVFFDLFLKIGEGGFECVPSEAPMRRASFSPTQPDYAQQSG